MKHKESLSRKLTFGIFYLLSSSLTSLAINVVTIGFIARKLGVENFGLYNAIFSFVGLFQFLSDFGLNKTLLKFGSTDISKAQISFGNALFVKSVLIFPLLGAVTLFGFFAGYRNAELLILEFFTISMIFESYGSVFSSVRRILGSFKLVSFFRVLKTLINLAIIIVALTLNNSVLSLAFATMLLNLIVFFISLINTILLLKPKLRLRLMQGFFKDSFIFSLNDFFLNVYARLSTVLLSLFENMHAVGIYSAALRFTRIANLLPNQVKFALLPTMYRILGDRGQPPEASLAHKVGGGIGDREQKTEKKVFNTLLKYMIIFATPIAISICFFSEEIIHLIFSKRYDLSIPLVQLFSLFIYLRFIETPFQLFYIAMNKHKNLVCFQGLSSLINLILNLTFIPMYSVYGACYATLISEISFALFLILIGSNYLIWKSGDVFFTLLKPTCSGIITISLTTILLTDSNVIIKVLFLLASYFIFLIALKVFDKKDIELFKKIFLKNNVIISN